MFEWWNLTHQAGTFRFTYTCVCVGSLFLDFSFKHRHTIRESWKTQSYSLPSSLWSIAHHHHNTAETLLFIVARAYWIGSVFLLAMANNAYDLRSTIYDTPSSMAERPRHPGTWPSDHHHRALGVSQSVKVYNSWLW